MKKSIKISKIILAALLSLNVIVNAAPKHSKLLEALQKINQKCGTSAKQSRSLNRCISDSIYYIGSTFDLQSVEDYKYISTYGYFPTRDKIAYNEGELILNSLDDLNNNMNITNNFDSLISMSTTSINGFRIINSFSNSHNLVSITHENLVSSNWVLSNKTTYSLNANNLIVDRTNFDNNLLPKSKDLFTYTNNKVSQILNLHWNSSSNNWDSSTKYIFTYGANSKLANYITTDYNLGAWNNSENIIMNYNIQNDIISYLYKGWDGSAWINNYEEVYNYNSNNQISTLEYWDLMGSGAGTWTNDGNLTYTYPNSTTKQQTNILQKTLNSTTGLFENNYNNNYTYTIDNQIKMYESLIWDVATTSWKMNEKQIYTYSNYIPTDLKNIEKQNNLILINTIVNTQLQIQSTLNQNIFIYNQMGSLVANINLENGINKIDVSSLSNGLYIIKSNSTVEKFIVIK